MFPPVALVSSIRRNTHFEWLQYREYLASVTIEFIKAKEAARPYDSVD